AGTWLATPGMPCGNLTGSGTSRPAASRVPAIQQSSMLTYWYPAAFMPELTIVSAVCSTSCSLTWQPNEFQSFQPIGGVRGRPLVSAAAGGAVASGTAGTAAGTGGSGGMGRAGLRSAGLFGAPERPEGAGCRK